MKNENELITDAQVEKEFGMGFVCFVFCKVMFILAEWVSDWVNYEVV